MGDGTDRGAGRFLNRARPVDVAGSTPGLLVCRQSRLATPLRSRDGPPLGGHECLSRGRRPYRRPSTRPAGARSAPRPPAG
ncbi:hypothetical protein SCOCK_70141 [Actinacidiphila cocklensis]|uniref:Uncharacterized protein n=1 Tax=Actinacidiphila cocklensis TaxID=887465 RepID=A0A9W4GVC7_9ACTN|nr:hypothetical protein SCOCK_70141 [Actinacidiphila cocklensis]